METHSTVSGTPMPEYEGRVLKRTREDQEANSPQKFNQMFKEVFEDGDIYSPNLSGAQIRSLISKTNDLYNEELKIEEDDLQFDSSITIGVESKDGDSFKLKADAHINSEGDYFYKFTIEEIEEDASGKRQPKLTRKEMEANALEAREKFKATMRKKSGDNRWYA